MARLDQCTQTRSRGFPPKLVATSQSARSAGTGRLGRAFSLDWRTKNRADHLRDTLQSVLVVPLRYEVDTLPEKIESAFARGKAGKKTALDVDAFRLVPLRIVVRPEGIEILIKIESKVDLAVKRL